MSDGYAEALAFAREELAHKQSEFDRLQAECVSVQRHIAKLRRLIYALSTQLGEPHGLVDEKPRIDRRTAFGRMVASK